jgi:hypothetical protein
MHERYRADRFVLSAEPNDDERRLLREEHVRRTVLRQRDMPQRHLLRWRSGQRGVLRRLWDDRMRRQVLHRCLHFERKLLRDGVWSRRLRFGLLLIGAGLPRREYVDVRRSDAAHPPAP